MTGSSMHFLNSMASRLVWQFRKVIARLRDVGIGWSVAISEYWSDSTRADWKQNSHWRDVSVQDWGRVWAEIGSAHVAMYKRFARSYQLGPPRRIMEWGVGGGANAVQFAPLGDEFVAVDVAQESLDETARQVKKECNKSITPVLVSLDNQVGAVAYLAASIDLFICFYVLELVPTERHAQEIVRAAHHLLRPGGTAIIQTKYKSSVSRRWPWTPFTVRMANSYIVGIGEFWEFLVSIGFDVCHVELVPRNQLDKNYAYYYVMRPK